MRGLRTLWARTAPYRLRDKEIRQAWRLRARNYKGYRMLYVFVLSVSVGLFGVHGMNFAAQKAYEVFLYLMRVTYVAMGDTPWTWTMIDVQWLLARIALWVCMAAIGVSVVLMILGLSVVYTRSLKELDLRIPGLSIAVTLVLAWFSIRWANEVVRVGRWVIPENLLPAYDFVTHYSGPVIALYVTGVSAAIAAVFGVARIRLHLGFIREGDTFKESAYYQRWTDSSIESLPALREQVRLARQGHDAIEPSATFRATVKDLYQAVFS
jgi:hypothetical protein